MVERGMAGVVAPGAGRGCFLSEVQGGRREKIDLPCASGSGSSFSHAQRGDRTIEAWPPSFYIPSCFGSPVVISQRDALAPRPHGGTEPTREARVGGHLTPGAFHTGLVRALRSSLEPGDEHVTIEAYLHPRVLGAVG